MGDSTGAPPSIHKAAGNVGLHSAEINEEKSIPVRLRRRRHGRPPSFEKEWYSKAEAASYLGVAEITVTRYLQRGILHAQRLPPAIGEPAPGSSRYDYGRLRIHGNELDLYLESINRNAAVPTARRGGRVEADAGNIEQSEIRPAVIEAEVMTREEAAQQLGVSWRTIKRYVESGRLRLAGYFRCPDSYTRAHVYRTEVEELLHNTDLPEKGPVPRG